MTVTVGDLFCGAGGFSEGFRQAGFRIKWAVDNWKPAIQTYRNNFPQAKVIEADLANFDFRQLEPVDVVIGGPPCTFFSFANKAGNGDKSAGLALVKRLAEAVDILEPQHWVMENVANLRPTLENGFREADHFSQKTLINAADYGVPQSRRRLFIGRFPVPPHSTDGPEHWIPMKVVINGLPCPLRAPAGVETNDVEDPLYHFQIPMHDLRDHFMNTVLTDGQIDSCIRGRKHHPWAGRMKFPDSETLPARTVVATNPRGNRGAIVLEENRISPKVYRNPTLREYACFQGFPISFQFWGGSVHRNHELIGNAVPPPVARSIALSIQKELGREIGSHPKFELPSEIPPPYSLKAPERPYALTRPYRETVPGTSRHHCSVSLDNRGRTPSIHPAFGVRHLVRWRATLYVGYARDVVAFDINLDTAWRLAFSVANFVDEGTEILERVTVDAVKEFVQTIPDASTLQAVWTWRCHGALPDSIVSRVTGLCRGLLGKKMDGIYSV